MRTRAIHHATSAWWVMILVAFALGLAAAAVPAHAAEPTIESIVVKFRDGALVDPTAGLNSDEQAEIFETLESPFSQVGYTRDGALLLQFVNPLPLDAARAALNRLRMLPEVLYANVVSPAAAVMPASPAIGKKSASTETGANQAAAAPLVAASAVPVARMIVKYRSAATTALSQQNQPLPKAQVDQLTALAGQPVTPVRAMSGGAFVVQLFRSLPTDQAKSLAAYVATDPTIEYAEPDLVIQPLLVPNDPMYTSQWNYMSPPAEMGGVNLPPAWDITTGSSSIVVAVIDTGSLPAHPDLAGRYIGGYDFIANAQTANDGDARDADPSDPGDWVTSAESASGPFAGCPVENSSFHGTHVAGTIGAATGNGTGVAGINWVSKILPLRVLGKCGGTLSDAADAISWAVGANVPGVPANTNVARVLNLSLGGGGPCGNSMQTAINTALAANAVVAVAAGNSNVDASGTTPANCNGVITVGATGRAGQRAWYSNFGALLEIAAPGGSTHDPGDPGVLSTLNGGLTSPDPLNYNYVYYQGTSMATPHVSGIASLMLSRNPALTPSQVLAKIQTTARAFPTGTVRDCTTAVCGAGIIDAGAAVLAAGGIVTSSTTLSSSGSPAVAGVNVTFTATVIGVAPSGSVNFTADGNTSISGCSASAVGGIANTRTATCSISTLVVGVHSIVANYSGDSNNTSSTSSSLSQVINTDSTPPSVPVGLAASGITASAVTITWSASTDNGAVAGYKVYRNGVQVGTPTGTSFTDTGLAPSTTYNYTVAAFDAVGNTSAQSSALPVTTIALSLAVAQWRFEEGSGAIAGDSSGNGNNGTLRNGVSWVSGEVGGAIQLDGSTQDMVAADSPSLSITGTGLTLAAWIYPTQATAAGVIHKDLQYSLFRNANGSITYADSATWNYTTIGGYGATPLNTWSHVAVTFDGSVIRFYVNGQQVGSVNRVGTLTDNANPLYLGSYAGSSNRFAGKLDEVQIFARALSAQEIAALQSGGSGDSTPPSVPAGLASSGITASTATITWSASTDNVGVTGYKVYRDGVQVGTPAGTSFTDTGLTASTTYNYTIAAFDAAGNNSAQSTALPVTTTGGAPANIPPTVNLTAPANNTMLTAPATVNLSANAADADGTVSKVEFYRDATLIATVTTPSSGTASSGTWSYSDTNVAAGTYSYTAKAYDNATPNAVTTSAAAFVFASGTAPWNTFARDAQHMAMSTTASQPLGQIHWQTPVDLQPQYSGGGSLLIHYGSPLVTSANTVIVPVKTGATNGFRVDARGGSDGVLKWSMTTDYVAPTSSWIPEFGPALTSQPRLYFPGAGGTVYFRDQPDANAGASGQIAFYGLTNYQANPQAYNASVIINTPLTTDPAGNIYFGFQVTGSTPLGLTSGIARISAGGQGIWTPVTTASADANMTKVPHNSAPALSPDLRTLYVAVSDGSAGYLVALDSTTLAPLNSIRLKDPKSGLDARLSDLGSASPTVGTDGDVYFGVLENPSGNSRGWLLHFNGSLSQSKAPGAFGWDNTASLVPAQMVPSYQGTSSYLLMSKYNNYISRGGDGQNKIAVLDPNATETDPVTSFTVMKEVMTIVGPTPDPNVGGVREWCINSAAVDPLTKSILANNEDGNLYRWDLTTNTLSQAVVLTAGIGQAYTPTVIGVDGHVYAINNAILFAVGQSSGNAPPAVAQWRFEEGSGAIAGDSSGNGNNGTLRNGVSWVSGEVGGAIQLDGSTQDMVAADSPSLSITGTGLTLAAWIYPTQATAAGVIHKDLQYSLFRNANGSITYADSATWNYTTIGGYGATPLNTWSHVAVTFDGSVIRFYVNGQQVGSVNRVGTLTDNANPLYLGSYAGSSNRFAGKLDEVQIFARALSAQEIAALQSGGSGDSTPPSVPAGLASSGITASTATITWSASTDNVGVTGYKVYRDGVQVGTPAGTSFTDTGLTASTTYNYTVAAFDAAGNNSAQSTALPVTTSAAAPDSTPPSVPVGLASSGITVSSATITWSASTDNVGVTGYKVYRNGVQVGTPAGTSFTDTGLAPSTTYNYTVAAFDAAGNNSAQSTALPVTTSALPPTVAQWRFEEGSGATAGDSSGNGNNGTLRNGVSWVSGEVGGAIQLDGSTQDMVAADSPSLSITGTGLTLAAWIYPTQATAAGVIHKDFHYSLFRNANGSITYADSATWNYTTIGGYGATPLNTWSHVAVTFDGSVIRFYVNGQQVGSVNRVGTLTDNANPLYLGSYAGSSNRFAGKLDEVQIFARALSAQEIAALQSGGSGDSTPPSVPAGLASSGITASTATITWSASTDNVGVTGYKVYRDGVQVGTPAGTSFTDTGLTASTTYNYTVAAFDAAGNNSAQSTALPVTTSTAAPDSTPPSMPVGLASSGITVSSATITWSASTDNVGVTGYKVYRNGVQVGTPTGTSFTDTGLAASTTYNYTVAAFDAAGNNSAQSTALPVTTSALPPTVAQWRFEEGSGATAGDSSGNGNNGTLRNGVSWVSGEVGGAIQLDGSTQDMVAADSPSLSITGTGLTLAAWIYPTQATAAGVIHKDFHYSLFRNANGSITYADSATWNYTTIGGYGATPLNTWSHVAVTFDGSVIRFYVNGQQVGSVNRVGTLTDNANPLYLGSYAGSSNRFGGKLDEVQIFARALSAQEIAALSGSSAVTIALQSVASGLTNPVDMTGARDGTNRLFLVQQTGQIKILNVASGQVLPTSFLDIAPLLVSGGEQGLLGLAFHPNYADPSNGYFYVNYTRQSDGATVIARYRRSAGDPNIADPNSASILLTVPQPYANHNGGQLRFGPDGYLYIGLGDGGSANDPEQRAQNLATLLGKMLRIDVDHGSPYAIPPGNPYQNDGDPNTLAEIWASGLRNPWRFSFDRVTGDLFIADVGQDSWEEIDFQAVGTGAGANYGWRIMEGTHCTGLEQPSACSNPNLTLPILEYSHSLGCAVTGGYRYRGSNSALVGHFFYGDYCSGRIWAAAPSTGGAWASNELLTTGFNISTFGEDDAGELYVAAYNTGSIYKIVSP